jgi:thiol:disulfide interchange protein DsbA
MNTMWKTAMLLVIVAISPVLHGADFRAGEDYEELAFPQAVETGYKVEVREFFWYGCPHCYAIEPGLTYWLKSLPENARFIRTPGTYRPWQFLGQVYYTLEALGLEKKLHKSIFDAIHKDHRKLNNLDQVIKFVGEHGVSRSSFVQAYNSFGVRLKMKRAIQLNAEFDVRSVPNFVVDGKYRTSPSLAKSEERTMKVLDFLIKKAARERKK